MSVKSAPKGRTLPKNPHYLEFERSDGDAKNWPSNTTRVVDHEGHVNYMRPIPLDESSCIGWRCGVAAALAKQMSLPELPDGHDYILKDWPAGYQMYDHNKGPADRPRHDPYLVGSKHTARFRSTPEFVPHALWLMTDPTMDRANCTCKYCSRTPQRAITQGMGLLTSARTSTPSSQLRGSVGKQPQSAKTRPPREPRVRPELPEPLYTAVRKKPVTRAATNKTLPGPDFEKDQYALPERINDVRAAYRPGGRYFREGELVWCGLEAPIADIRFWPALVEEIQLKARAVPTEADGWTYEHTNMYKLKMLAVDTVMLMPADAVIPYVAYSPSDDLLKVLMDATTGIEIRPNRISNLDLTSNAPFVDAAIAHSIAVQMAVSIASGWCGTDDYQAKFVHPPAGPSSLANALNASMRANAHPSHTQTRFQGIWWGPERVWVDDLVRLKCDRSQVGSAEHVSPPAGPSAIALERLRADPEVMANIGGDETQLNVYGASSRGVFMRVDGIFLLEVPQDGKVRRECRLHGPLFELANEDWVDPSALESKKAQSEATGSTSEAAKAKRPATISQAMSASSTAVLSKSLANMDVSQKPKKPPARTILTQHPPLPPAPEGYRFRPILKNGREAVLSVAHLSGRYYQRILVGHPEITQILKSKLLAGEEGFVNLLEALEGLASGSHRTAEPTKAYETREAMVRYAHEEAMSTLFEVWRSKGSIIQKEEEEEDIEMMDG